LYHVMFFFKIVTCDNWFLFQSSINDLLNGIPDTFILFVFYLFLVCATCPFTALFSSVRIVLCLCITVGLTCIPNKIIPSVKSVIPYSNDIICTWSNCKIEWKFKNWQSEKEYYLTFMYLTFFFCQDCITYFISSSLASMWILC